MEILGSGGWGMGSGEWGRSKSSLHSGRSEVSGSRRRTTGLPLQKANFMSSLPLDRFLSSMNYYYDGPTKGRREDIYLRLGVDRAGNLLEIVYHEIDVYTVVIFHAMKCQNKYYSLLNL
jgi:hypothetical protein